MFFIFEAGCPVTNVFDERTKEVDIFWNRRVLCFPKKEKKCILLNAILNSEWTIDCPNTPSRSERSAATRWFLFVVLHQNLRQPVGSSHLCVVCTSFSTHFSRADTIRDFALAISLSKRLAYRLSNHSTVHENGSYSHIRRCT